jgi:hypothetical protein
MSGHETRAENEVTDLKKEVMSLKGLLLSRFDYFKKFNR